MTTATIKLFLPFGDAKRIRTGEISNWSGKALAAPRTDLEDLLKRPECDQSGVYLLFGTDSETDEPSVYIGEAEVIRERIKQHRSKDFWLSIVVFTSKDDNLTKAHIRYLESRLLDEAKSIGRYKLVNFQSSGSRLPESDLQDMEVFLERMRQLLPVMGGDLLTPITESSNEESVATDDAQHIIVFCRIKGAEGRGMLTANGFVVFAGSTAVAELRPSAERSHPFVIPVRNRLISEGYLTPENGFLKFTRDTEFTSPSSAAAAIHGGGANGWKEWKSADGRSLGEVMGRTVSK